MLSNPQKIPKNPPKKTSNLLSGYTIGVNCQQTLALALDVVLQKESLAQFLEILASLMISVARVGQLYV